LKKYPNDERDILFIGDSVLDMTKIDLRKKYLKTEVLNRKERALKRLSRFELERNASEFR